MGVLWGGGGGHSLEVPGCSVNPWANTGPVRGKPRTWRGRAGVRADAHSHPAFDPEIEKKTGYVARGHSSQDGCELFVGEGTFSGWLKRDSHDHGCPLWLFWSKNRWRFLVCLVVSSSTRETHLFAQKDTYGHDRFFRAPKPIQF